MSRLEERLRDTLRAFLRLVGGQSGMGFPHPDMEDDVRVEPGDQFGDPVDVGRSDPDEPRTLQVPPRWVNVEPQDVAGPVRPFGHGGDK